MNSGHRMEAQILGSSGKEAAVGRQVVNKLLSLTRGDEVNRKLHDRSPSVTI